MSRRIRVNLTRWVCKTFGHDYVHDDEWQCRRCQRWFL